MNHLYWVSADANFSLATVAKQSLFSLAKCFSPLIANVFSQLIFSLANVKIDLYHLLLLMALS